MSCIFAGLPWLDFVTVKRVARLARIAVSEEEANRLVCELNRILAQATTDVVSSGALLGFLALVLGVIAAWFGGVAGTKPGPILEEYTRDRNP